MSMGKRAVTLGGIAVMAVEVVRIRGETLKSN